MSIYKKVIKNRFYKFLILVFVCQNYAQNIPNGPWTELFNGENLDGWEYSGDPPWHVENGLLRVQGGNAKTYLIWPKPLKNVEMQLKYKLSSARANSGIQVRSSCTDRSKSLPDCGGTHLICGPQLDVANDYSGRLFEECAGFLLFSGQNIDNCRRSLAVGQWTTTTARFVENKVSLWLNGTHCLDYTLTNQEHIKGEIFAIQSHAPFDLIEWEFIRIRDLDKPLDVPGCTNPKSSNYNASATVDDSTCFACTNSSSVNYDNFCDTHVCVDDGSCTVPINVFLSKNIVGTIEKGKTHIEISVLVPGNYTIDIYDVLGKALFKTKGKGPLIKRSISIQQEGIFFVTIQSKEKMVTKRIINL